MVKNISFLISRKAMSSICITNIRIIFMYSQIQLSLDIRPSTFRTCCQPELSVFSIDQFALENFAPPRMTQPKTYKKCFYLCIVVVVIVSLILALTLYYALPNLFSNYVGNKNEVKKCTKNSKNIRVNWEKRHRLTPSETLIMT